MFSDPTSVHALYCAVFGEGEPKLEDDAAPEMEIGTAEVQQTSLINLIVRLVRNLVSEVVIRFLQAQQRAGAAKAAGAVTDLVKNQ